MASDHKARKYDIVAYDPHWRAQFETESRTLKSIFGDNILAIEHVGSTAVPGLAGKPTIDVLVLVDDVARAEQQNQAFINIGYEALGEYAIAGALLFVKEKDETRLVNVHIFQKDHPHAKEMLEVRNFLRTHPEVVKEYSQLKIDLLKQYPTDYGSYRKYKDEWMDKLKSRMNQQR